VLRNTNDFFPIAKVCCVFDTNQSQELMLKTALKPFICYAQFTLIINRIQAMVPLMAPLFGVFSFWGHISLKKGLIIHVLFYKPKISPVGYE
jgi:hypothetical protein